MLNRTPDPHPSSINHGMSVHHAHHPVFEGETLEESRERVLATRRRSRPLRTW